MLGLGVCRDTVQFKEFRGHQDHAVSDYRLQHSALKSIKSMDEFQWYVCKNVVHGNWKHTRENVLAWIIKVQIRLLQMPTSRSTHTHGVTERVFGLIACRTCYETSVGLQTQIVGTSTVGWLGCRRAECAGSRQQCG